MNSLSVDGEQAPVGRHAVEADLRAVIERGNAGDGAVGVQIAVLRVLREVDAAAVERRTRRELIATAPFRDLA